MSAFATLTLQAPGADALSYKYGVPWAWPALFDPAEVEPVDAGEPDEPWTTFRAEIDVALLRERARRLREAHPEDPRFAPLEVLAQHLEGREGAVVLDPTEVDAMGEPGALAAWFIEQSERARAGVVGFGSWAPYLECADLEVASKRARRFTGCKATAEAFAVLAVGYPTGPWRARWVWPAASEPPLRDVAEEAELLLAALEERRVVRVEDRKFALRTLALAARHRTVEALAQFLDAAITAEALVVLRPTRVSFLDRILPGSRAVVAHSFYRAVLEEVLAVIGD